MTPHGWLPSASMPGTCCMICSSCFAVLAWMTRCDGDGEAAVYVPAESVAPSTRVGCTRTPPLAIVAYTSAICIAVAATPCPNASVYLVSPYHCDTGGRSPSLSSGRPTPVGWPGAEARRESYCVCSLMWFATWDMPMLEECAMMPAMV